LNNLKLRFGINERNDNNKKLIFFIKCDFGHILFFIIV